MSDHSALDLFQQRRHRLRNTVHTWLLATGSLVILAVSAWAFAGPAGIVYAIVFGTVSMWAVRHVSPKMVLRMYKAEPVSRARFPQGVAIVEELAREAGLPAVPSLHVVPSGMVNAFAVGRRENSAIAVTDAMLRLLTLRELAGVLAHEIVHIASEDVKVMAFADMVSRFTSLLSTVGVFSLFLNLLGFAGGYQTQVPWLAVLVLVSAPTIGGLLQLALSRTREFDADLGAAVLTADPDGLASALIKLERAQSAYWESLVLPGGRNPAPSMLRTHPPVRERVARLMALKHPDGLRLPPAVSGHAGAVLSRASVPRIRPAGLRDGSPLLSAMGEPVEPDWEAEACRDGLCPPDGRPRLRMMRGGVWW